MKTLYLALLKLNTPALNRIYPVILLFITLNLGAQEIRLRAYGNSVAENLVVDSLPYLKNHNNLKSVRDEINKLTHSLILKGYFALNVQNIKVSDTSYEARYNLGKKIHHIDLYLGSSSTPYREMLNFEHDTISIETARTETFINNLLLRLEQQGYSLATVRLGNINSANGRLEAEVIVDPGNKRVFNDIVINGYDKFPEGYRRNLQRMYRKKALSREALKTLSSDLQNIKFISQTRFPEILFLNDTTKVYVYLEKSKPNRFEGYIGFANEESSKINFNGFVDIALVNLLNSGEEFSLYWKSDGKEQKTFNLELELPYIFQSRFGLKGSLNIFRQDSTFQNTATNINLGYYFNQKAKVFVGYRATESSDIQNTDSAKLNDYKNSFITTTFDYRRRNPLSIFFPEQTRLTATFGTGKRNAGTNSSPQYLVEIDASHEMIFNSRHSINVANQTYILGSNNYLISELFRFGGIMSIRGFNENSLQGDFLTALLAEYRYTLASNLYVHTITDYGYFSDNTSNLARTVLGVGFGFGIATRNGLLNLVYANGSNEGQQIKLSNSIVHISFKTSF